MDVNGTYSIFCGSTRLVTGTLEDALRKLKRYLESRGSDAVKQLGEPLIFCDRTGKQLDFDLRGPIEEVLRKALPAKARVGPGRPKLGVVSREISLLPRHWEWLEGQPNGASAALRRLVENARQGERPETNARARIEAVGRVMTVLAGNLPGFEEAYRALYRRDLMQLTERIEDWPPDVRSYILEHVDAERMHE